MNQKNETDRDVITIVTEPGAVSFVTRKEWRELPEAFLGELTQHETVLVFMGTDGVFFLMRNIAPGEWMKDNSNSFRLVKISTDEDGKQKVSVLNLFRAEAAQLMQSKITLWE